MRRTPLIAIAACVALGAVLGAQQAASQQPPAGAQAAPQPAPPAPGATGQQVPPGDPAQQPPVTFRIEVSYVEVDAIVTDGRGNPVRGLTRDDFEVLEDGKPQRVDLFTFVDLPIERAEKPLYAAAPIEPDVQTNAREFDGRLYVILLDDLHTNVSRSALVRVAARRFIQQNLGDNDLAAVVYISGRAEASQEFTSSQRLLLASVDKFMGRKIRSSTLERLDEYNRTRGLGSRSPRQGELINDPLDAERGYDARSALDTLKSVAQYMTGIRGRRKAVLLFSEGIDYDIYDVFNNREATTVLDSVRAAIGASTRANVSIYGIDPRGLGGLAQEAMELSGFTGDPSLRLDTTGLQDELRLAQDSLRTLSDQTGGFAVVNTNDFDGAFERVVKDNSSYYVLGYYPTNDKRDGRFRKIEVRVKRPDVEVRARKGYVAPRGKVEAPSLEAKTGTSAALRDALNSPLPESGLPMAIQATAFKGAAPNASVLVTVQFGGGKFQFSEEGGVFLDTLEMSMLAVDASGKVRGGDRNTIELKLRPQTRQAIEAFGFRATSRLELPPGRYQLRVAGRTTNAGHVGAVHYDLDVPDFSKEAFSISGVVLTSGLAAYTPSARADEQLKDVLPGPPTTLREFRTDDEIALFAEVYDNEVSRPHRVDIVTTVRDDAGRTVFKHEDERSSDELQGARGGYGYTARVPLKEFTPGLYVLRVEAKSRLSGNEQPVAREVQVLVRPAPQPRAQTSQAGPAPPQGPGAGVGVVGVVRGPRSGTEEYQEVVARTDAEWQALWSTLPLNQAAPKVNFENTMVAAIFVGTRPTSGYSVEIVGARTDGDTLVIQYAEGRPATGTMTAQVMTTPYAVAGVPMHAGPVRFEKVEKAAQ